MGKIVIADRVRSLRASTSLAGLLLAGVVAVAPAQTARAGTVWVGGTPGFENDYDTASNWAPADVPNGLGETAEFNNGTIRTTVSKTGATSIDAFQFDAGAPSYTINLDPGGFGFELHGAGIVNNSGVMQTINLLSPGLVLLNNASLGDANVVVNLTGTGQLNFLDASTGGLATVNIGGNFGVLIDGAGHALTLGALSGTDGRVQFSGANQSLTVGGNNLSTTFGGTFTEAGGTGSLTKVGTGTLTLTNPGNAYSGGTTISGGTLTVGAASALGTGSVSLGNAHLRAAVDFAVPGSAFIFQSGSVSRVSAAAGTTLTIASTSLSFSGPSDIHFGAPGDTGTVALGSWIDANLGNTYAIDAGTLKLVGDFVVPLLNSPGLTVASGAKLDMNGTQAGTKVLSGGGTITNGAAGTTSNFRLFGSGADSLFSGRLEDGAGTVSLSKDLGSALTLSGTNTYSGSTQITGGTLRGGATNAFSAASAVNVAATLDLGGFNQTIGSLSGPGRVTNSGASLAVLSTNGDNRSTTFSGVIDNGAGGLALAKAGTGTLTLSGINTYSGGTMIGDGVLIAGGASALGSSAVSFTGNSTLRIGFDGTLANIINGTSGVSPTIGIGTHVVRLDGALSYLGGSGTTMHFGEAGDTGTLILAPSIASLDRYGAWSLDSGTLQLGSPASGSLGGLSAADLAAGTTLDLNGYVLQLVNPTGSGTVLNNGSSGVMLGLSGTSTFAGAIENGTQPISVTKFGTGTTTLSGVSTYTGVTNILDGTLALSGDGSIKDSSSINLSSLSALDISQTTAGTSVKSLSGGSSSSVKLGSKTLTIDTAGNTSYAGVISGSGGVTKTGGAVLDLFGANTYFGSTNVAGGLMRLVTGTTLLNSSAINISNGATFSTNTTNNLSSAVAVDLTGAGSRFATSTDQQIGSLAGAAGTSVWLDPGVVLTTGASNTNTIFSGNLGYNGEGSLTKVGTGSFTLNGTNGYTGTTTIKDGSLIVNGSIVASSLTTVEAGATLGGSGTVGNTVVDGTLSAGNSPGTLTVDGDLTLGGGSKTVFELNTPGLVGGTGIAGNDLVDVHDNLTLGGALDASVAAAGYYRLFNYGGTLS
ncbi:MAG: beta strand repeat-containing protein, partial [Mesorhizobium sp.]